MQTPSDIPARGGRMVLVTTILASSLAFVDGSVVNVGLPAIGRSVAADPAGLQWIVNAYLLPLSALLLLGGAAGDRFGRRRLLILGVGVFILASGACAAAPSLAVILAGRLAQGAGAAMLMPNSLAILGQEFSGAAKGRAIGMWAAAGAMGAAVGPVLGGWMIDLGSWRPIFLLNIPLGGAAMFLAWRFVPRDAASGAAPLDWAGGALATAGLGLLSWGLTLGAGHAGWTPGAVAATCLGAVGLVLFVLAQRRLHDRAMMPLSLFLSGNFVGLTVLTLLLYGALGGMVLLLPYTLIVAAGYSAAQAGAALVPLPIVISLTSPLFGGLAGRFGSRLPLSVGPLVMACGFLLGLRIGIAGDYVRTVLPAVLVIAIGLSGAVAPLTTAVLNSVNARHVGSASGFNSAVARTGGLIATALLGTVLAASGAALVAAFHVAMVVGAVACLGASGAAAVFIRA
jgi:EmrB/QacA subfamily drug resistance transporter